MKLLKNQLIGLSHWDATGESLVGIITKISASNYLSRCDVKSLFLQNPKQGQLSYTTRNAANEVGIDLESIESLFSSKSETNKSFCEFYLPAWLKNERSQNSLYDSKLRVCHECLKLGKHLCIHQVKLFSHCPIHNAKLQYTCLKCSGIIKGWFEIPYEDMEFEFFNCFRCTACGYDNLILKGIPQNQLNKYQQRLTLFLQAYETWLCDISTEYSKREWLNVFGNTDSTQIALEISKYPQIIAKKLHYQKIYISGSVKFEIGRLDSQNLDYGLVKYKTRIFNHLLKEILLFGNEQLGSIKKRFGVTKKQHVTSCLHRAYPDNYWGENCSIWAQAYVEVNYALSYRHLKAEWLFEEISTHFWLIRMWYSHFAEPLLKRLDITDERSQRVVLQLSKIWLRKFILVLFLDEVYRLCKGLIGKSLKNYSSIIERTGEFEPFSSLVVSYKFDEKVNELQMWHKWERISSFIDIYECGFMGYNPKTRKSYEYYKKLHELFSLPGNKMKQKEYLKMLSSLSVTKIGH